MSSKYMVLDSNGALVSQHATMAAAEKRVARLVTMSKGKCQASDFKIVPWQGAKQILRTTVIGNYENPKPRVF